MTLDLNERLQIYYQSPETVRELYGSDSTASIIKATADAVGLEDEPYYGDFVITVGDLILGLRKKESLPQLLKDRVKLNDQQIQTAVVSLQPLLQRIPTAPVNPSVFTPARIENPAPSKQTGDVGVQPEVQMDPVIVAPPSPPENTPAAPEPVSQQPGKEQSGVKPLRTFAQDVEISRAHSYGAFKSGDDVETDDENVHTTSQDDILKK